MDAYKFPITAFGSILGTGGFALASRSYIPILVVPITIVLVILFSIFSGIFLVKTVTHPDLVRSELNNPITGNFYALQPISAVVLAVLLWHLVPTAVSTGLLVYGAGLIFALSVYLPYHFFSSVNVEFSQLHGGWFITPVATILVTNAVLLYPVNEVTLIIALLFFGTGATLFILVLSALFFRLISHSLPPVELAPTNYIVLAPIGILIVDVMQIARFANQFIGTYITTVFLLGAIALWGFGVWAIGVNLLLLVRYIQLGFKFHLGWWSFVFPTAAFTLGTVSLSEYLNSFRTLSLIVYSFLLVVFAIVAAGSFGQLINFLVRVRRALLD